jgi:hypothetical protein
MRDGASGWFSLANGSPFREARFRSFKNETAVDCGQPEPAMKKASLHVLLAAVIALPLTAFPQGNVTVEAEAGLITPPFIATNGCILQAVGTNLAASGRATYAITIAQPGDYVIQATVSSPERASSIAINIDAEPASPTMIWDIPASQEFTNRTVTWRGDGAATNLVPRRQVFNLTPGPHQLIIRGGDAAGARIDRLSIARIPAPPGNLRVVATP